MKRGQFQVKNDFETLANKKFRFFSFSTNLEPIESQKT